MRIRSIAAAVGLTFSMAAVPAVATAAPQTAAYQATLSGAAEVPAVTTSASGAATAGYDADAGELDIAVAAYGLEGVVMAHLHNAAAGANGPVVVTLLAPATDGLTPTVNGGIARMTISDDDVTAAGDVDGTVVDLVAEIDAGNVYVNIHTVDNPGGELRGQLAQLTIADAFTDDDGATLEDEVNALAATGVLVGDDSGNVDQTGRVTRGQLTAIVARGLALPVSGTVPFPDVVGGAFETEVAAAAAAGLVLGDTSGNFNGADPVTRGELSAIISRAYSIHDIPVDAQFGDVDFVDGVFGRSIEALAHAGVVNGFTATEFRPADTVSRGQAAAFVARAQTLVQTDTNDLDDLFDLTVLHNNDGESKVVRTFEDDGTTVDDPGVASFKTLVDQAKATAGGRTSGDVFVSSGDNFLAGTAIQASVEADTYYDAIALEALGYDAIQFGNHDFDFGPQFLSDFLDQYTTTPQYLGANIDAVTNATPLADEQTAGDIAPSTTVTVDGREVGIVGAIFEELATISSPGDVIINEVLPAVQAEIDTLTADGVDIIVVISHLQGVDAELDLIPTLSDVDIVIAGGGSEDLANPGTSTADAYGAYPLLAPRADGRLVPVVTTTGGYGELGRLVGGFDTDGDLVVIRGESQLIANAGFARDATLVADVETPVKAFQDALATNVIGTTEVPLNGIRPEVRTVETNQGNLHADALLDAAIIYATADAGTPTPVAAFQNGGGIRNDSVIPAGDVTLLDTFNIAPFGNFVSIDTITHALLLDVLENAVSEVENVDGRFLQVSDGFVFSYDSSAAAGSRIVDVSVAGTLVIDDGTVLAPAATIVVATNDFTFNGGDSFPFDGTFIRTTSTYQAALSNYIENTLGGTITAADYPVGGEGRITDVS